MTMQFPNTTLEQLQSFIAANPSQKLLLSGPLGAGKTTYTKQRITQWGISSDDVTSPTYTYSQIYDDKVLHIDMRRIESYEEFQSLGLLALIEEYEIIVVERPKRTDMRTDKSWTSLQLGYSSTGERVIQMETTM